ncbi:MAG TPA: peptidoglycan DD-metalloendopeptidase family protein [Bauldia sp.]|nr:peptidoglycan DD-metalloendopeptidase family protein [Bauldia sp.]
MRLSQAALAACLIAFPAGAAWAQDAPPAAAPTVPDTAPTASGASGDSSASKAELIAVTEDIQLTAEREAELQKQIDDIDKERANLNQALIDSNTEVQRLEGAITDAEKRLGDIVDKESALRASLNARRDVLADVLAALQRMGRRPPPILFVEPEDALASIRSAILLGAVVPDLRSAADQVASDLAALVTVRQQKEQDRDQLRANAQALAEGHAKIAMLIEERQKQRDVSAGQLQAEQARAATLADQATSLKDLIARMEQENATAAAAAAAAAKATAEAAQAPPGKPPQSLGDADRLTPKVAFADAKGLLPMPVNGSQIKAFGDDDGIGGKTEGISLATRSGAEVSSPSDGWVVYAGPFRSYGQLLIINAGDGYHVLLAGMERIDVQLGQFVLAGEPVAAMASQRLASVGPVNLGGTQPVLYIEFRKDGAPIDPAPWWAASNVEKVGG